MTAIRQSLSALLTRTDRVGDWALPILARLVFAGVLLGYFWASAMTKFAGGPFSLSTGAFAQIYPKTLESLGYDASKLGVFEYFVVLAGSWAEVLLPLLILLGLATRLAALGMIGFVVVQSLTDVFGHMAGPEAIGAWFDRAPDALILDQRAFWVLLFAVLALKGAGPLSIDRLVRVRLARQ